MRHLRKSSLTVAAILSGVAVFAACETVEVAVAPALLPLPQPSLGFEVGVTRLDEVRAHTQAMGLKCKDASPSAVYAAARKGHAKASAKWDAKTSASPKWNSSPKTTKKRMMSPQFRWSCSNVPSSALPDIRNRPHYTGRWLFVFDDDKAPLRHVSFRRSHFDLELARADIRATAADWKIRYERPKRVATIPPVGIPFPRMKPLRFEWDNGQRRAKLSALSITGTRVDILEAIELVDFDEVEAKAPQGRY